MSENVIAYKISVAVFRNFLKMGLMTANEFVQAEQILAEKYAVLENLTVFHDGSMVFLFKDGTEIKI